MSRKTTFALLLLFFAALLGCGLWYVSYPHEALAPAAGASAPVIDEANGSAVVSLGQTATVRGVTLLPLSVEEDSRCATDVQCIWAGRVQLKTKLSEDTNDETEVFTLGEPFVFGGHVITLTNVEPAPLSHVAIQDADYRFTFKVTNDTLTYTNASADLITVTTPTPGAVVGKTFSIKGSARGTWYFEASFPVEILDADGNRLAAVPAEAEGNWMTEDFVPFSATLTVPESYTGAATIVLHKDNPSGESSRDASVSFPITVEY